MGCAKIGPSPGGTQKCDWEQMVECAKIGRPVRISTDQGRTILHNSAIWDILGLVQYQGVVRSVQAIRTHPEV